MSTSIKDGPLISAALLRGISWWWRSSGLRIHHLIAFVGIQMVSWVQVHQSLATMQTNEIYWTQIATAGPLRLGFIGALISTAIVFLVLSSLALLDGRIQIFLAISLLVLQQVLRFDTGALVIPAQNEFRMALSFWGERLLLLAISISTVLLIWSWVKKFARKVDSWFAARVSLLREPSTPSDQPKTISIMSVLALISSVLAPVLGIVLGYVALNDLALSSGRKWGKELAVAAIVIAVAVIALTVLGLIVLWLLGAFLLVGPFAVGGGF